MTCSMTAFARAEARDGQGELVWELRTVNHRFLDVSVRLPEELRALEPLVRERATGRLGRGKLDATLRFKGAPTAAAPVCLNRRVLDQLLGVAAEITGELAEVTPLSVADLLSWPGVVETAEIDLSPVHDAAARLLAVALDELMAARVREGERLAEITRQRCRTMREHVRAVRALMPQILDAIRDRLRQRLAEVTEQLDAVRLEQEMVLLAQRLDVDEELDRLNTHLDEVERVLGAPDAAGRRLDFLMQELNREANTISSKSSDAQVTRHAVEMKVLIEQMREQVQNIE